MKMLPKWAAKLNGMTLSDLIVPYLAYWKNAPNTPESWRSKQSELSEAFLKLAATENSFFRTGMPGHFTASAVITTSALDKVLLTHHKKLNRWLQLGGHADGDENLINVALREGDEESAIKDLKLFEFPGLPQLFDLDIHWIPENKKDPGHYHYDARFLFITHAPDTMQISDESHDLRWFSLEDALKLSDEESLNRLFLKTLWVKKHLIQ